MGERLLRSLLVIAAAVCTGVGVAVAPLGMLAVLFGLAFCWFFLRAPSRLVYLLLALLPLHMIIRFYHPLLPFWKDVVAVVLIAASLGVLYAGRRRGATRAPRATNPLSSLLYIMLAAHVAWVLARFAVMDSKPEGLMGLQQHVLWPLSFVAMTLLLRSLSEYTLALRLWIAAAVVVSALGIYESVFLAPRGWFFANRDYMQFEGTIRVSSTFDNPLSLGCFLALLLPLLVTQTAGARTPSARIALWGAVFVTSLTVVLTISRGPMVQALVGTALALALLRALDRKYLRSLFVVALAFIAVAALAIQFVPEIGARIVSVTDWRRDEGNRSRIEAWSNAFEKIQERPLVGHGPGVAGSRSPAPRPVEVPESQFLQILIELGLVGFVLYTPLLLIVPLMGVATLRSERDPERYLLTVGATAATTVFLLEAAVLQIMEASQVQVFYWYAAALLHFLYTTRERRHATSDLPLAFRHGAVTG